MAADAALADARRGSGAPAAPPWGAGRWRLEPIDRAEQTREALAAREPASVDAEVLRGFEMLDLDDPRDDGAWDGVDRRRVLAEWRASGWVVGVRVDSRLEYPKVQFDGGGRPLPVIAQVLRTLEAGPRDGWVVLRWLLRPEPGLDGARPMDVLAHEPGRVVRAAERQRDRS